MSILITGANSAQAHQLNAILGDKNVILGDFHDIPDILVKAGTMVKTPHPKSTAFVHQMLALCLDKHITKVYALRRDELLPLDEARQLFTEFEITLIIPSKKIIEDNIPHQVIGGSVVIVENGRVVEGDFLDAVGLLQDKTINGVFKVNTEDYIIFTAD